MSATSQRFSFAAVVLTAVAMLSVGCSTAPAVTAVERTLRAYEGKPIAQLIEERRRYPDSESPLPNGGTVYRFTHGSGGRVDEWGNVTSNVCRIWIETDAAGVIVRWRYENCA